MTLLNRRLLISAAAGLSLALATGVGAASAVDLHIGWQQIVEPSRVPQAAGAYEKATGATITWSQFGSGADVVAAIASGAIDIGYVGSSPLTRRGEPATADRNHLGGRQHRFRRGACGQGRRQAGGPRRQEDRHPLRLHLALFAAGGAQALEHRSQSVQLLNLRPADIGAAWTRGDIDGAYVWDPVLTQIKTTGGKVLADSADVAKWGAPTFDAWIVRKDFADKNPDVVKAWVKVTADAYTAYLADPSKWSATSPEAAAIAKLTGANAADVPELLKGYVFPSVKDEAGLDFLGGGTVKAITATAAFLVEQGKIPAALPDYSAYVDAKFAAAAAAGN